MFKTDIELCMACDLSRWMPPHYGDPTYDHNDCPSVTPRTTGGMPWVTECYSCGQDASGGVGFTLSDDPDNEHFLCPVHAFNIGVDTRVRREA